MDDLTSPRILRQTLARYGLNPRKSLGQNFLIDANMRDKILAAASPGSNDLVVEVGAGAGTLTEPLAATGAAVLAVEIDPGLARILGDRLPSDGSVAVLVGDALRLDLRREAQNRGWERKPALALGNLPYYITTPILFHLLQTDLPWYKMVFLVQREVAARMAARPGQDDYGLLSVAVQYRAVPEILAQMPPTVFWPAPKVYSTLIGLAIPGRFTLPPPQERAFFALARAAFGQRRKTLQNACRDWAAKNRLDFASLCRRAGIDPGRRGEELAVDDFAALADAAVAAGGGDT